MTDGEDIDDADAIRDAEALTWLFEDGAWIPASHLVGILGDDAAAELARWAGASDGHRYLLRTRARIFEVRRPDGSAVGPRVRNRLYGHFWQAEAVASNCIAGNFERQGADGLRLTAIGVEVSRDDLDKLIGERPIRGANQVMNVADDLTCKPPLGRPRGTDAYLGDAAIVRRVIELCDNCAFTGPSRITHAIHSIIGDVEPRGRNDDADADKIKVRRVRGKVVKERPDLRT